MPAAFILEGKGLCSFLVTLMAPHSANRVAESPFTLSASRWYLRTSHKAVQPKSGKINFSLLSVIDSHVEFYSGFFIFERSSILVTVKQFHLFAESDRDLLVANVAVNCQEHCFGAFRRPHRHQQ
jgi:hypothetical protein